MNIRKYSYIFLWAGLILTVLVLWLVMHFTKGGDKPTDPAAASSVPAAGQSGAANGTDSQLGELMQVRNDGKELVGVWVPFMSLTTEEKTEAAFQANFRQIVATAKEKGVNALFVHVRPYCDALYASALYPWSHILTGTQGQDPGYDPLRFMVEEAHANGMQLHAWINPLRVKTAETPGELAATNPYAALREEYPYYFMEHEGAVYLNPAYSYIRTLIADGAAEIVQSYEVDGVHFDDYFYPGEDGTLDETAYTAYTSGVEVPLSLADWRRGNINAMVAEVYQKVKRENPDVVFGISPAGNIENDMNMGADVKAWCAAPGYIDYICPQLYYSFDHPQLGYSEALQQWLDLARYDGLNMYIGLALYKAGTDADEGTWQNANDIIKRQIEEARAAACGGVVLYASDFLQKPETEREVANAMAVLLPENNGDTSSGE